MSKRSRAILDSDDEDQKIVKEDFIKHDSKAATPTNKKVVCVLCSTYLLNYCLVKENL